MSNKTLMIILVISNIIYQICNWISYNNGNHINWTGDVVMPISISLAIISLAVFNFWLKKKVDAMWNDIPDNEE